jgi:hypothetical protein
MTALHDTTQEFWQHATAIVYYEGSDLHRHACNCPACTHVLIKNIFTANNFTTPVFWTSSSCTMGSGLCTVHAL